MSNSRCSVGRRRATWRKWRACRRAAIGDDGRVLEAVVVFGADDRGNRDWAGLRRGHRDPAILGRYGEGPRLDVVSRGRPGLFLQGRLPHDTALQRPHANVAMAREIIGRA